MFVYEESGDNSGLNKLLIMHQFSRRFHNFFNHGDLPVLIFFLRTITDTICKEKINFSFSIIIFNKGVKYSC